MSLFSNLPISELSGAIKVIQESFGIRTHQDLFHWLRDCVNDFLPHEILVSAWGDFVDGPVCYDIVSPLPGIRTELFQEEDVRRFLSVLYEGWVANNLNPYVVRQDHGFSTENIVNGTIADAMNNMRCAMIHGIKDCRGRHDTLYVLLAPDGADDRHALDALMTFLPYIDTAFRQSHHLPGQFYVESGSAVASTATAPELPAAVHAVLTDRFHLSSREEEIMAWVRQGKTNQEIGMILGISGFTVKNHMQRIFRKLDVMNRAQAVAKVESLTQHAR
jgi:transcriptional regulator EpsA